VRGLTIRGYGTAYLAGDFDIQSTIGLKVYLGMTGKVALSVAALIFPFGGLG